MTRVSLDQAWQMYRNMAVSSRASDVQLHETRKAFYAGAATVLEVLKRVGDPQFDDAFLAGVCCRLVQESEAFVAAVSPARES